jgi:hypothetical protein
MATRPPKTVLITGASSGIGTELARAFARGGSDVVLVARSADPLERLAAELSSGHGVAVRVLPKDLSLDSAAQEIHDELAADGVVVDGLVNNAGFIVYGPFKETDLADELRMIEVNLVTPTRMCKLFGRDMARRGGGRILNLGSTGSFVPGPLNAVYCATKSYILSLSEAISAELGPSGVTVTALCPGATATGFQAAGQVEGVRLLGFGVQSARAVAEAGYRGMLAGRRVVVPGFGNRLVPLGTRLLPRRVLIRAAQYAMERPERRS